MAYGSIDLIVSFLFTWSVGIGLPALVRFLLYRRPLLQAEALTWAIGLGLTEAALFIALGSQNKTHAVLILIGWVAYKILRRPVGPFDARSSSNFNSTSEKLAGAIASDEAVLAPGLGESDVLVPNGEKIGFRFLLLAWSIGTLMLLASGLSYIQWSSASNEVGAALASFHSCGERLEAEHPTCRIVNGNYVNFDQCMSLRDARCGIRKLHAVVERRDNWYERAEFLLLVGACLLGFPTLMFYVLRWAVTGRTRPLWIRY
jgi:hypothetical protein